MADKSCPRASRPSNAFWCGKRNDNPVHELHFHKNGSRSHRSCNNGTDSGIQNQSRELQLSTSGRNDFIGKLAKISGLAAALSDHTQITINILQGINII
ncbi:MAG: hypothetical protein ACLTBK_06790 [Blautia wexlerae]